MRTTASPRCPSAVSPPAFDPDGKLAAVACPDGVVRLWPIAGGRPEPVAFRAHPESVSAVAFSPDGKALATGGGDGTVKVWDVATRKERVSLRPRAGGRV